MSQQNEQLSREDAGRLDLGIQMMSMILSRGFVPTIVVGAIADRDGGLHYCRISILDDEQTRHVLSRIAGQLDGFSEEITI